MQTIKGLGALLIAAVVVFAIGGMNNLKSQAKYAAKLRNPEMMKMAGKTTGNENEAMNADAAAPDSVGKAANVMTNRPVQARLKTPRT